MEPGVREAPEGSLFGRFSAKLRVESLSVGQKVSIDGVRLPMPVAPHITPLYQFEGQLVTILGYSRTPHSTLESGEAPP